MTPTHVPGPRSLAWPRRACLNAPGPLGLRQGKDAVGHPLPGGLAYVRRRGAVARARVPAAGAALSQPLDLLRRTASEAVVNAPASAASNPAPTTGKVSSTVIKSALGLLTVPASVMIVSVTV